MKPFLLAIFLGVVFMGLLSGCASPETERQAIKQDPVAPDATSVYASTYNSLTNANGNGANGSSLGGDSLGNMNSDILAYQKALSDRAAADNKVRQEQHEKDLAHLDKQSAALDKSLQNDKLLSIAANAAFVMFAADPRCSPLSQAGQTLSDSMKAIGGAVTKQTNANAGAAPTQ